MRSNILLLICLVLITVDKASADNDFEARLLCYGDLQKFSRDSKSHYFSWAEAHTSYLRALFTAPPKGNLLILPSKRGKDRGFFIITNNGFHWKTLSPAPIPGKPHITHYFELSLPEIKRGPLYVHYPDFLLDDGSEYGNINIGVSQTKKDGIAYTPLGSNNALEPQFEQEFNNDLIGRIKGIPSLFNDQQERRKKSSGPPDVSGPSKDEYLLALRTCRARLRESQDSDLKREINLVLESIEAGASEREKSSAVR